MVIIGITYISIKLTNLTKNHIPLPIIPDTAAYEQSVTIGNPTGEYYNTF